ncbi:Dystrophin-like protein 1, partial [Operophtera brumata]
RTILTPSINLPDLPECITKVDVAADEALDAGTPLSAQHQLQLLRERLDQQAQQTRAAVAQLLLLRDQLAAEQAARCEAQELLEHIAALVAHLQDRERVSSRPISAQQLTLLPQTQEKFATCNGNRARSEELIDLFSPNNNTKNSENSNGTRSPFRISPSPGPVNGAASAPCFGDMSNEQIQDYLITRFEEMGGFPNQTNKLPAKSTFNANQQYYQNCQAFPNIPPLVNHYSNSDLQSLLSHSVFNEPARSVHLAMSEGQSDNSLFSPDTPDYRDSSSKDSSDSSSEEGISFIKPLSHNGTLTATGEDGRVRLIVPVSPSESVSDVAEPVPPPGGSGNTLTVPGCAGVAPNAPITRTTSEKVPNRSEMMTAMRQQWTRHTTK